MSLCSENRLIQYILILIIPYSIFFMVEKTLTVRIYLKNEVLPQFIQNVLQTTLLHPNKFKDSKN